MTKTLTCLILILAMTALTATATLTNDVAFTAALDGSQQRYVVILPDKFDPAQPHGLLICLHGHGSDRWQFVNLDRGETTASRDVAAMNQMIYVSPDYRAKTSWMAAAAEADMIQLIGDLKKQYAINKVILSGGSMGASSALTFTALHPELIDGVVALNGLADHLPYKKLQSHIAASFGGTKKEIPDEYRKRSAINFPEKFTMPLAITAGGKDTSVPPESVIKLGKAVQKFNPSVFIDYDPNRGHETNYEVSLKAFQFVINAPQIIPASLSVSINDKALHPAHATTAGVWFYTDAKGENQLLLTGHESIPESWQLTASLKTKSTIRIQLNNEDTPLPAINFHSKVISGSSSSAKSAPGEIIIKSDSKEGTLTIKDFTCNKNRLTFIPQRHPHTRDPVKCSPDLLPSIADALIEWDWRMQDGIGTPREPRTYAQATEKLLKQMIAAKMDKAAIDALRKQHPAATDDEQVVEAYWLAAHRLRRKLILANPQLTKSPLLFAKHVPSVMSHQLTQMYGYCSQPGGGLFILEQPGISMRTRDITPDSLPAGNFMTPELSFDAERVLFAYCPVKNAPKSWGFNDQTKGLRYHIHELTLASGTVRTLTQGDTDNFFPVCLPGGDILFSSTMRGGYHRCGRGPCFVYTLARMSANGENPRSISFHETHEWDPCLLNDGRIIYTRWDYVDRNAVHYQHLWSTRPDGGNVRIYYGNNSWAPTGIWEARSIPGSTRVMATAAPHHGMSAGSIVLVDTTKGVDGKEPLTRLTPEVRFPEAESPLARGPNPGAPYDFDTLPGGYWNSPLKESWMEKNSTVGERRWPGHCYKSPWPLSEDKFIVSYSFDRLVGEAGPNLPNMFGIYFADAFGNKELLYRDPNIASLWARPLAKRTPPPELASAYDEVRREKNTGTFFLSNVMESWPALPKDTPITHLRITQVLLKTTPNIDSPKIAAGLGAPGRQVLGTVPVEKDGSAYFEAPARTPIMFQALDAQGRAVQTMRSLVYLQPGENETCIGCHEHRMQKDPPRAQAQAIIRPPSIIKQGPDGSKPFSYPRLVQPILDRHCLRCHDGKEPKRPVLTGAPEGAFSKSFNSLIKLVSFSAWNRPNQNYEPLTEPLRFGAIASPLAKMLEKGHNKVELSAAEWESLNTWMDANGAFYGTFDRVEQKKQLAGEVIAGPAE
ncbi:MAG: prolyl oligopeptidase family serine peptidase [Kiritimatiellae bacterium]|jgi:predicted esterase|nr:prolyl oligopeptidase family serine peptidase [Kiritimatiellia bacterium]